MLDQKEAQARLEWAVGRMPGIEGVAVKVVGDLPRARLFWTQFARGNRMVFGKAPRSMIEMVDPERGILPFATSCHLPRIVLLLQTS